MMSRFVFTAVLSLLAIHSFAANGTMKGEGSAEKPFQIEDYDDLKAIGKGAYLYSSNYVLTADIDASASAHEMCSDEGGCNGFIPIGKNKDAADSVAFWGTIDGQNHTILNLTIWLPCEQNVGFIYALVGSVKNLNFDHLHVTGRVSETDHVGGVVARLVGTIENVHVTNGFVQGKKRVGGIVGAAMRAIGYSGMIPALKDVSFQGEIKGTERVGGIVGETDEATIDSAVADVNIIAMDGRVGGIVGFNDGRITNSRSKGTIVPGESDVNNVGGIAGESEGDVQMCVSTMDLVRYGYEFDEDIGGIVGDNDKGTVSHSYAIGKVEGERYVGGVVGSGGFVQSSFAMGEVRGNNKVGGVAGSGASIFNSYAANKVLGDSLVGGLIGYSPDTIFSSYWNTEISGLDTSAGGTGLSTAKMMKLSSFAGWDTLGYDGFIPVYLDTCDSYLLFGYCHHATGSYVNIWKIDEGKSFPYLALNPYSQKSFIPIATPTVAAKWQEQPPVASLTEVDGELVGKWLGWVNLGDKYDTVSGDYTSFILRRDTLYYGYRIGVVNEGDTVWGTSSYVAVPNGIKISTLAELQKIGNDMAYPLVASYELTADIDAAGVNFRPIGDSVHVFAGVFDGKNHTIKNLTIVDPYRDFAGMFGVADGADIKNLKLENAKVEGDWYVGALAGEIDNSRVTNVVSLNGNVSGMSFVGGLMGATRISEIHVVGTTGYVTSGDIVGGIFGASASRIVDAFSVNVVKGYENVGGVMGISDEFSSGTLQQNIYSASILKAPDPEGIIGGNFFGSGEHKKSCYFDSTVTGNVYGGNTTEEMLKQSTYEGFNFDTVWAIQEGVSYPYFKGMDPILPGTLEDDGTVNMLAGTGTERNPYKIYDYDDLKYIGKYEYGLDKYYKLMSNINASSSFKENCNADSTLCKGFEPIGEFSGGFDGNNKFIAGLNINRPDEDSVGLFRALVAGAKVSGVVFDTASYLGKDNSYGPADTRGTIHGKNYVGTLAGVDKGATLEKIFVKYDVSGENYVGSVVGKKSSGSLAKSASRFLVSGNENVGGLVGHLGAASVADCYSIANVVGTKNIGGLFGYSDNATVKNSFAAGRVVGSSKWGVVAGDADKSTYTSVYGDSSLWFVNVTAGGELRTTRQMVTKENYKDWDFDSTWSIAADTTYPYLSWFTSAYRISKTMKEKVYPNLDVDQTMLKMAGSGTESDPFLIKTYGDLKSIGYGKYKLSSVYRVANDIDASASKTQTLFSGRGIGFNPIGKIEILEDFCNCYGVVLGGYIPQDTSRLFTGKIHGGGHSISDLYMDFWDSKPTGLVDTIAKTGVIDSLSFKRYEISREEGNVNKVGALAGVNMGTVSHVDMDVLFKKTFDGAGLVYDNKGLIENCSVKGIFGGSSLAGISVINDGDILNVNVDAAWSDSSGLVGGIALVNRGLIKLSSAKVSLNNGLGPIGGIAAMNTGTGRIVDASVNIDAKQIIQERGVYYYVDHKIKDYEYEDFYIDGIGGLVAIDSGTITNSAATGVIDAKDVAYVGGLIAKAYSKELKGLHASVDVGGMYFVGGFVGLNQATISESYAAGNVKGSGNYSPSGAFVGKNEGVIERSFAMGNASAAAGFVGENDGTIRRSYSTGNVEEAGGFANINQAVIEDCYSTGDVSANETPYGFGFASVNGSATKVRGYASGTAVKDGNRFCVDLPRGSMPSDEFYYLGDGCIDTLATSTGLSPSAMRKQKSFSAFDFDSVWYIKEGVGYPMLRGMPNPPMLGEENAVYNSNTGIAKNVRAKLLEDAFVMDTAATKVLALDSAGEALLDSLENAEAPSGKFEVSYRVGVLLGSDTLWSKPATMQLEIEKTVGNPEIAAVPGFGFGAAFRGPHVALRFDVPAAGAVKFALMDMQGRVVRTFNLGLRAAGAYSEALDAGAIARGRYVGVLQVNGRVAGKALLLKR